MRVELSAESPIIRQADQERLAQLREWMNFNDLNIDTTRRLIVDTESDSAEATVYITDGNGKVQLDRVTKTVKTTKQTVKIRKTGQFIQWLMS